jgi:L-methionine (R)-S-oxide reductase
MIIEKEQQYQKTLDNIKALIEGEEDVISILSTISCEIYHCFDYMNWVGFYRNIGNETLKVGPYQGGHGCLTIPFNKGVCGACASQKDVQIENDVQQAKSHIACSSETKSEIVLPVFTAKGELHSVLDVDSVELNSFDQIDVDNLTLVTSWVSDRL